MERLTGRSLSPGIACGRLVPISKKEHDFKSHGTEDVEGELLRWQTAKKLAKEQLKELYDEALKKVGQHEAEVFSGHGMIVDDPEFISLVEASIKDKGLCAEAAVAFAKKTVCERFELIDDEYIRDRIFDIEDVSDRLLSILSGAKKEDAQNLRSAIVMAPRFGAADVIRLEGQGALGFVAETGSYDSHAAILARTMEIPMISGIDIDEKPEGVTVIVDGISGELVVAPDDGTLEYYMEKSAGLSKKSDRLAEASDGETFTLDGKKIDIYANINGIHELEDAKNCKVDGIGLFRSEYLYLNRNDYPSEEEQLEVYKGLCLGMEGKRVVIRTMDIGGDKQADYMRLPPEPNPALGYRGIRVSLDRLDIFKTQLRAVCRAACFGNVALLFPMIVSVDEVIRIKAILSEVKKELKDEDIPFGQVQLGVMIETPAAVWISKELASEVDFLSIGTNDLTQYILAADREGGAVEHIYDQKHPAVLRAIGATISAGHEAGVKVCICGEIAADTVFLDKLLKMGADALSVSLPRVSQVRDKVMGTELSNIPDR